MDKHILEYRSKFFKLSRLDEIKTRFYNSRLDELAFFQDLETLKSFRTEEEKTTTKKKKSLKKKKPPDSSDESDEKTESYSDTETIFVLNKENTTEANTSFLHGSSRSLKFHKPESKGNEEENTTQANSIFLRRSSLSLKSHIPEFKGNEEENTTQANSIFLRRSSLSLKSHIPESKGNEKENTTQANSIFLRRSSLSLKSHIPESKGNEEENTTQANSIFLRRSSLSLKSHTPESKGNEEEASHSKSWKSLPQKTVGKKQAETKPKETNRKLNSDNKTCDTLVLAKNHVKSEEILEDTVEEEKDSSKDEVRQVLPNTSQSEDGASVQDPSKTKNQDIMHKESGISSLPPKYEQINNSKDHGNDSGFIKDDNKKSKEHVASISDGHKTDEESKARKAELTSSENTENSDSEAEKPEENQEASDADIITIDDSPPMAAPFDHRIVSARKTGISSYYHVHKGEVLGGGRFGQVHKCEEKGTGLKLAAKIIKARGQKEKDEVKNEINIMNQLNHVNLIQLYDAFESKYDLILVMEYVEGGELFDRIIDENSNLTEIDTILFIKQICEGVQYMHQMYILHLDLKPENILCVNREANQIKIIDFGLARRYKPREKLKVNFGTPEFLAPEVVNYDFVSFPTDMWSVGVIAYMLLSGLSPFLGDDDNETLNNILACRWDFEDQEFENVSEEAKDFISKLLIKAKGWRMSAAASLKHPWLSDQTLHRKLKNKSNRKDSAAS